MSAQKKKLLVTGAGGFLGWNICRAAIETHSVAGVIRSRPITLHGVRKESCDITDFKELRTLFDRTRPDAVIHAAAEPRPDVCQQQPHETRRINVDASIEIAGLCHDAGIPCVFVSSDLVFDGASPPYSEERETSPVNVYGEQKVAAEEGMRERHDRLVVCRVPLMYGDAPAGAQSFIQPFIKSIVEGVELRLFCDEFRTPACGASAARGLIQALSFAPGTCHLGGRERISRYDFCKKLAVALGRPNAKLTPVSVTSATAIARRPVDVSLDSSKAFALGYNPGMISEELSTLQCVSAALP
jgi:dTDP-4-dehydrorhamnose reductase